MAFREMFFRKCLVGSGLDQGASRLLILSFKKFGQKVVRIFQGIIIWESKMLRKNGRCQ